MSTILLVENNARLIKSNKELLTGAGYQVLTAASAAECSKRLSWYTVDLILLELSMPEGNGLSLCKEIREKYSIPIILISASGEKSEIVAGLRAGADDYLSIPYEPEILLARIEARLRGKDEALRYLCYGTLKLDILWGCGYLEGKDMLLTPREFAVLLLLAANADAVVPASELINKIWHNETKGANKALWTLISRLRKKLRGSESGLEISSVRGLGYMLERL